MNFSCRHFPGDRALHVEQDSEEASVTDGNCYLLVLSENSFIRTMTQQGSHGQPLTGSAELCHSMLMTGGDTR